MTSRPIWARLQIYLFSTRTLFLKVKLSPQSKKSDVRQVHFPGYRKWFSLRKLISGGLKLSVFLNSYKVTSLLTRLLQLAETFLLEISENSTFYELSENKNFKISCKLIRFTSLKDFQDFISIFWSAIEVHIKTMKLIYY